MRVAVAPTTSRSRLQLLRVRRQSSFPDPSRKRLRFLNPCGTSAFWPCQYRRRYVIFSSLTPGRRVVLHCVVWSAAMGDCSAPRSVAFLFNTVWVATRLRPSLRRSQALSLGVDLPHTRRPFVSGCIDVIDFQLAYIRSVFSSAIHPMQL